MPADWDGEQIPWDVTAGAEPLEDWLATVIRRALQSSVGDAEPPASSWIRIRQNIETMASPLLHKEEDLSC